MPEPNASFAGGAALIKIYGLKAIGGVLAVGLTFMFLWPKSAKEGFVRIVSTISGSLLWGDVFAAWVRSHFDWMPHDHSTDTLLYVCAGVPAWWILGLIFKTLQASQGKSAQQLMSDLKGK